MSPKVSIVVPTYAPGDRINGLVQSLERQSMPSAEFEVVFVDDGSPDDTYERLKQIRATHDNVRIERIPNSGWPSRPRNVGLEMARGEYVLFMDHDDELYPDALRAGYEFAHRTGADVLNGKETRTDQAAWAVEVYDRDADNVVERTDLHPLLPTNPHKLFRRELLMQHDIRFPEGRRVLWEDVFFALDVAQHATVVSTMSSTPFYHWVRGATTASSSYGKDRAEFWRWVREIVLQTNDKLSAPHLRTQWRLMLLHQYRTRVLNQLGPTLFAAGADQVQLVRTCVDDIVGHITEELDQYLTPTQLGRATLVRAGRWDLLEKLVAVDAAAAGISRTVGFDWDAGTLHIEAETRWYTPGQHRNEPLSIRYDGQRIVRDLPAELTQALPARALDVTDAVNAATTRLCVRDRETGVVWALPGRHEARVDTVAHGPEIVVSTTAVLDPATAALGAPLNRSSQDFTARNELFGQTNQRGLRTALNAMSAMYDGHVLIAYRNKSGMLSLDVDENVRSLAGTNRLNAAKARSVPASGGFTVPGRVGKRLREQRNRLSHHMHTAQLELPFAEVWTADTSSVEGTARLGDGPPRPATVQARTDTVWLQTEVHAQAGTYPLTLHFHGRDIETGLTVTLDDLGAVTVTRVP